jgi:hypothetical protein
LDLGDLYIMVLESPPQVQQKSEILRRIKESRDEDLSHIKLCEEPQEIGEDVEISSQEEEKYPDDSPEALEHPSSTISDQEENFNNLKEQEESYGKALEETGNNLSSDNQQEGNLVNDETPSPQHDKDEGEIKEELRGAEPETLASSVEMEGSGGDVSMLDESPNHFPDNANSTIIITENHSNSYSNRIMAPNKVPIITNETLASISDNNSESEDKSVINSLQNLQQKLQNQELSRLVRLRQASQSTNNNNNNNSVNLNYIKGNKIASAADSLSSLQNRGVIHYTAQHSMGPNQDKRKKIY